MLNITCNNGITLPLYPNSYRYTLVSFLVTTAVTSGFLNSLVLLTIWTTFSLHKPSYYLIATIALSDFLAGFFGEIMLASSHIFLSQTDRHRSRQWQDFNCTLILVCKSYGYILCGSSISTFVAMSVDRLLAITMKTSYNNNSTVFKVISFCPVASWAVITVITCYTAVDVTLSKLRDGMFFGAMLTAMALCSIIAIYSVAYLKLKATLSYQANAPHSSPNTSSFNLEKYRKTLNTFVLVCALFSACYAPFTIASIMYINELEGSYYGVEVVVMFLDISDYLVYFSATMNPVVYIWRMKDLRNAMKQVVRQKKLICQRTVFGIASHIPCRRKSRVDSQ